jgi:glycosyltransferase involved in cell wall biosynthesis
MTRIGIVTPHLATGDAIGNDVLGMYDAFTRRGIDTRLFAVDWTVPDDQAAKILPLSKLKQFLKNSDDILIYHFSMGWREGLELLEEVTCRRVIKYHNISPPEFFAEWTEEYKHVCQQGRDQIADIARANCDRYLSASAYNMKELVAAGAAESKNFVVPPFNRIDSLMHDRPDFEVIDKHNDESVNLLMVGTLFPHKGHASLLEAFSIFFHFYNSNSRLFIVGQEKQSLAAYAKYLRELATRFGVAANVVFTGHVDDEKLKSYYLKADMFVTCSDHEGFCVPLVESMALGVPVVALGSSAIPETVGEAGIIWPERDPLLFAETFATLANDEMLRADLAVAGQRRYTESYRNEKVEERLFESLVGLL